MVKNQSAKSNQTEASKQKTNLHLNDGLTKLLASSKHRNYYVCLLSLTT